VNYQDKINVHLLKRILDKRVKEIENNYILDETGIKAMINTLSFIKDPARTKIQ